MPRPPLILASHKLRGLSGKVILVRENARRLARGGWGVTVAAQDLDEEAFDTPGVGTLRVGRPPLSRVGRSWWLTRRVQARARRTGALVVGHGESLLRQDVLHVHNAVHRAHEALHGRPLDPGREPDFARAQRRILGTRAFTLVVANSRLVRDDLVERYGLDPDRVAVVYPGHDPERFHPAATPETEELRRSVGARPGELVVGLVTSGDFRKRGVGPFLKALGGLAGRQRAGLRVLVVGHETPIDDYLGLARRCGMGERVCFVEPREDVATVYRALDLMVHPAAFEEFGMTVLEAMACGTPVLAPATVGATELLEHGAREELLPGVEAADVRGAVAALLADPDRRRRLGEAGIRAARGATWAANVRGHERVYERAAAGAAACYI